MKISMTNEFTLDQLRGSVGPCPKCNSINHWLNNVPLTAYCWGSVDNEHPEWSKVIPAPFNPYK